MSKRSPRARVKPSKHLLRNPVVKSWYDSIRAKSEITAAEYLRRLNALVRLTRMQPREMVEKCRAEGDGRTFVVGLGKKLGGRGLSSDYVYNHAKALSSWLEYNHVPTPLRGVRLRLGRLSSQVPSSYLKTLPTKQDVAKLLESCVSSGGKLAVALAAFSGLRPGQVRELVLENLVEFSLPKKQFSSLPSRVELRNRVTGRKYYSFLGSDVCKWLLDDLSTRGQVSSKEKVVSRRGLVEASRVLRAANVKWFELRLFFRANCELASLQLPQLSLPHDAISFILGNYVPGELDSPVYYFSQPKFVSMLRRGYSQVENEYFI